MLRNVLIPPILCAAAKDGDLDMILSNLGGLESASVRYAALLSVHTTVDTGYKNIPVIRTCRL